MAHDWYTDDGTQIDGPMTARELRERAAAGRLRPTHRVSSDRVKWVPAEKVKGLIFGTAPKLSEDDPTNPHPALKGVPPGQSLRDTAPPPSATFASGSPASPVETVDSSIEQIPGYEVQGVLGSGACGVVFRARQLKLNRIVALKTVLMDRNPSPRALARFDQEAVSLARLQHPNIVAVYDCGHHEGRAFFAMELLAGEDLGKRIERAGPLDERTAWLVARQTAAALAHAADLGVIHRDVKPANLFLVPPPTGFPLPAGVPMVKVTDFGLAFTRRAEDMADARLTAAGVILGTPVYMAPEQFAGTVDLRADIYGLGATVYHALSGIAPFEGGSIWEVMLKKATPAPRLGPPVSAESAELVAALLAEKPEQRIGTYAELMERIDALPCVRAAETVPSRAFTDTVPNRTLPASSPNRGRRSRYLLAGGVLLLGMVALGLWISGVFTSKPALPPKPPVTLVAGPQELLYVSGSLLGWVPSGAGWSIEDDEDKTPTIAGKGTITRPFKAPKHFRITLALDPYRATAVEVVIATQSGDIRWLVRIDPKTGAAFGKRTGAAGAFESVGNTVPVPPREQVESEGRRPYFEVRYERANGQLTAFFRNQELGRTPDDGSLKTTEFQVIADGGPVRIDFAAIEELVEK